MKRTISIKLDSAAMAEDASPNKGEPQDKLLFILVYFRLYPTQEVQGFLFGIGQPQAHDWVHKLTRVLNQALGYQKQLPEREPSQLEAVLNQCPSLEFMIDGTERRINRPKDKEAQKVYYSGKKRQHTVKNNVISQRRGKVVFLSDTYEGKKHDKAICDLEDYRFPKGSKLSKDSGFQGYEPTGVDTFQPKKKPRQQELTLLEKQRNREISRERIETNASHWWHQTLTNCGASALEVEQTILLMMSWKLLVAYTTFASAIDN